MQGMYSTRSPAVKRLMKEAQELSEATEQYYAQPLDDNLFEWHFTIRGPSDSDFSGGLYHGRIVLPPDYPMKPPSIILLTPNGRFETNKKICLSISGHHPESWQPSWSIRTALLAIIGFMPTHGAGAIGSLDYTPEERKRLANRSKEWKCPTCGNINCILKAVTEESEESKKTSEEAKELASQINFQAEKKPEDGGNRKNGETTPTPSSTQQPNPQIPANSRNPQIPANTPNPFFPGGFPFPSPLMCMPNTPPFQMPQGVAGNATVPRFPPPPPFIPGMFPPGSGQNVFMQQWQMNPFMMGRFPVPPTMFPGQLPFSLPSQPVPSAPSSASQRSTPVSPSETLGSRSKSSTVSAAVKSQTPGVTTSQKASQNVPNTKSSSSAEDSVSHDVTESSAPSEISTQGSENPKQEPEKIPPGTESNPGSSTSLPQQPTGQRSTEGVQSPSGTESIPSSSTSLPQQPTGQRSNEGVRQRLVVDNEPVRPTIPTGRVGQSAELRDYQSRRSGFSVSGLIIFIIGLAIALLLIRRFFLSRNWRFYYGV